MKCKYYSVPYKERRARLQKAVTKRDKAEVSKALPEFESLLKTQDMKSSEKKLLQDAYALLNEKKSTETLEGT